MSKPKKRERQTPTEPLDQLTLLRKMTRLLEILVRLDLQNLKSGRSQNEMINLLDSVGCGQPEIADFLGTTTETVKVTLYKARRKAAKK